MPSLKITPEEPTVIEPVVVKFSLPKDIAPELSALDRDWETNAFAIAQAVALG